MHQKDRGRYLDATVKRGVECNTDHQLLCVKVKMGRKHYHHRKSSTKQRKFDVSKLVKSKSGDCELSEPTQQEVFQSWQLKKPLIHGHL